MAEKIAGTNIRDIGRTSTAGGRAGRPELYPWDEWLDGDLWRLDPGEDFESTPEAIRSSAQRAARNRGLKARTRLGADGEIYVQAEEVPDAEPEPARA